MIARLKGWYDDQRPIINCRIAGPNGFGPGNEGGINVRALVDTGCSGASVPDAVALSLGIPSAGQIENFFGSGYATSASYMCEFAFDLILENQGPLRYKVNNVLCTSTHSAPQFDIILGMGVLNCFNMNYPSDFRKFELWNDFPV